MKISIDFGFFAPASMFNGIKEVSENDTVDSLFPDCFRGMGLFTKVRNPGPNSEFIGYPHLYQEEFNLFTTSNTLSDYEISDGDILIYRRWMVNGRHVFGPSLERIGLDTGLSVVASAIRAYKIYTIATDSFQSAMEEYRAREIQCFIRPETWSALGIEDRYVEATEDMIENYIGGYRDNFIKDTVGMYQTRRIAAATMLAVIV